MEQSGHSLKHGCVVDVDSVDSVAIIDNVDIIETASTRDLRPAPRAPHASPRRRGFTIIELLGVILTLATLFGLILPAVKLCTFTARKKQAAADATALSQAVLRYRQTYGFWPGADANNPETYDPSEVRTLLALHSRPSWAPDDNIPFSSDFASVPLDMGTVVRALVPSEATAADGGANPRRIRFLDIPSSRIGADGLFRDPWGTPYALVIHPPLEQPPEGTIPGAGDGPKIAGRAVGWSDVVAFSFGPPGRAVSAADNLIFSAGVPR